MTTPPDRFVLQTSGPTSRIAVYAADVLCAAEPAITAIPLDARQCWGRRDYGPTEEITPFPNARAVKDHYGSSTTVARRVEVQLVAVRTSDVQIVGLQELVKGPSAEVYLDVVTLRARGFKGDLLHAALWGPQGARRPLQDMRRFGSSTAGVCLPPALRLFADGKVKDRPAFRPVFIEPAKLYQTLGADFSALVAGFMSQDLDAIRAWAQSWPEPGAAGRKVGGMSASVAELLRRQQERRRAEEGEE
jgi:hypothetical protein